MNSTSAVGVGSPSRSGFASEESVMGGECSPQTIHPDNTGAHRSVPRSTTKTDAGRVESGWPVADAKRAESAAPMSSSKGAGARSEPEAGTAALLRNHQARDLSGFLKAAGGAERVSTSGDEGSQGIQEFDPRYGRHEYRSVPNSAASSCNDGKSYCNSDGDIVEHTVAKERELLDQVGEQFDTRNFRVPALSSSEPQGSVGTLSLGTSAGVCFYGQCAGVTGEVTAGVNGSVAGSVGGYVQTSGGTNMTPISVDSSVHIKLTDASDASEVASGEEVSRGVQLGPLGASAILGETYEGVQLSVSEPGFAIKTAYSRSVEVAR